MKKQTGEFETIVNEMLALHKKKQADYGSDRDPFSNVRSSEEFGIPAWLGAILRANDKVSRLKTFARKRKLANESVEDSFLDLANYAVIALVLWREQQSKGKATNGTAGADRTVGRHRRTGRTSRAR